MTTATQHRLDRLRAAGAKVITTPPKEKAAPVDLLPEALRGLKESQDTLARLVEEQVAINRQLLTLDRSPAVQVQLPTPWTTLDIRVHSIKRDAKGELAGLDMRATRTD